MSEQPQSFEQHLEALQAIVDALESGDLALEASLERYQEGVGRLKTCFEYLKGAEAKVKQLVADSLAGDGTEVPFDEGAEEEA